jgi:hypothetical protein
MVELFFHSPICLHGILLNELSTGTTVPFTQQSGDPSFLEAVFEKTKTGLMFELIRYLTKYK